MLDYQYALSEAVAEYAFSLDPSDQSTLIELFRALANNPYQPGDFPDYDEVSRSLEVKLFDHWLVTYWSDHSAREVRILDVVRV
ncbi:MAG: hypothetical protein ACI9TH_004361 [Kiritimatiellia bacterium]|jgi:hypothetical protein